MEMQSRHGARTSDPDQQAYLVQRGESCVILGFRSRWLKKNSTTSYIRDSKSSCQKYNTHQSYFHSTLICIQTRLFTLALRPAIAKLLRLLSLNFPQKLVTGMTPCSWHLPYACIPVCTWLSPRCPSLTHILVFPNLSNELLPICETHFKYHICESNRMWPLPPEFPKQFIPVLVLPAIYIIITYVF